MKLFLKKHSATILSIIAATGTVLTAVTAANAAIKAQQIISEYEEELTRVEVVKTTWKCYVPTVIFGGSTIACIFGANILGKRQQASLVSTYTILEKSYKQYQDKLKELYGVETHNKIVDAIISEKVSDDHYVYSCDLLGYSTLDFGKSAEPEVTRLFYDRYSERYFESTIEKVIQAEYHLNRNFMLAGGVSLNDYFELLGLETDDRGNTVGWSCFNGDIYWIDFNHRITTLDNGTEICVIEMVFDPTLEWDEDL